MQTDSTSSFADPTTAGGSRSTFTDTRSRCCWTTRGRSDSGSLKAGHSARRPRRLTIVGDRDAVALEAADHVPRRGNRLAGVVSAPGVNRGGVDADQAPELRGVGEVDCGVVSGDKAPAHAVGKVAVVLNRLEVLGPKDILDLPKDREHRSELAELALRALRDLHRRKRTSTDGGGVRGGGSPSYRTSSLKNLDTNSQSIRSELDAELALELGEPVERS